MADAADSILFIGDIELILLTLGGTAFLTAYSLLAKWWRWREGRFVFAAGLWLTVLFAYIWGARAGWLGLGDELARAIVRMIIFTGFGVALVWICALLIMAQLEKNRVEAEKEVTDASER